MCQETLAILLGLENIIAQNQLQVPPQTFSRRFLGQNKESGTVHGFPMGVRTCLSSIFSADLQMPPDCACVGDGGQGAKGRLFRLQHLAPWEGIIRFDWCWLYHWSSGGNRK